MATVRVFPNILSPSFESLVVHLFRPEAVRVFPFPRFEALVSRLHELENMASDGMLLTNHDHQIRVGILTGRREIPHHPCFQLSVRLSV